MYAIRNPKAAGLFYNSDRSSLEREIELSFNGRDGPKDFDTMKMIAMITPSDKYHLSGSVSAWSYAKIPKANYVIIGGNHFDAGSRFAIMKEGLWQTPLGEVTISTSVAQKIIDRSKIVDYDVMSHEHEHSVEVQLPFLQYRFGNNFKIVPIAIRNRFEDQDFVDNCKLLGKAIAQAVKSDKERWVIIAATNMTQGKKKDVMKKDKLIMDSIKNLSEKKFYDAVHKNNSQVYGYGAVITAMAAAKTLKGKKSRVLKHKTSIEVMNDPNSVTGYASIIIQ